MIKLKGIKITTSAVLLAGCINSFCVNNSLNTQTGQINAAIIYATLPIGAADKTILYFTDSLEIIEYKKFRVFQFFSVHTSNLFIGQKPDGSPISQKTTVTITKKYFVTKMEEKDGFHIDPVTLRMTGKSLVDSLHKTDGFLFGFYKIYESHKKHSFLYATKKNESERETIEKYTPIKKNDKSFTDTMYYYYSAKKDYTDITFSFSPEQDTLGKGKMYKAVGKYIGNPKAEKLYEQLEKNISIELKPIKVNNPELIKRLCEKAEEFFTSSGSTSSNK